MCNQSKRRITKKGLLMTDTKRVSFYKLVGVMGEE